jgi:hypothetical protein
MKKREKKPTRPKPSWGESDNSLRDQIMNKKEEDKLSK